MSVWGSPGVCALQPEDYGFITFSKVLEITIHNFIKIISLKAFFVLLEFYND